MGNKELNHQYHSITDKLTLFSFNKVGEKKQKTSKFITKTTPKI
jgi:hypothetical protein